MQSVAKSSEPKRAFNLSFANKQQTQFMFYKTRIQLAKDLVASQIVDGWTRKDIVEYFEALGYEYEWIKELVNPFYINNPTYKDKK